MTWIRFCKLTEARARFAFESCVYVQADPRGKPLRVGKASAGLDRRYHGGDGYALDAAMHASGNLVFAAAVPGDLCDIVEAELIWRERDRAIYNNVGKSSPPERRIELDHLGDVPYFSHLRTSQAKLVRRPMGVREWVHVGIYANYADRVRSNIQEERYFEAMAVAVTCLDALVHDMVEGLLLYHKDELGALRIEAFRRLDQARLTAGQIIDGLEQIRVLDPRLMRTLRELNRIRNTLVHPFKGGQVKSDAIMPGRGDDEKRASQTYRLLCHVIDVSGGRSPRTQEREYRKYMRDRRRNARKLKDRGKA